MQQLSETIMSVIEATPLLYQFLSIFFFIERFSDAVLHCNLNCLRSCWAMHMIGLIWFVHLRICMNNLQVVKLPLLMSEVMLNSVHCKAKLAKHLFQKLISCRKSMLQTIYNFLKPDRKNNKKPIKCTT